MRTVRIYRAQPICDPVEPIKIEFDTEVPNVKTLEEAAIIYRDDAAILCNALQAVLPGGTFDRLLIKMLEKKASLFKVPFFEKG